MRALSRRSLGWATIILAIICFVALNVALTAGVTRARLDLTENRIFTLAQGTRDTISKVQEPITLRFFYSRATASSYAQIQAYANRVRDLLQNYAALSDGRIVVQFVDPEPFTAAEDEAVASGLTGAPNDKGDMVYFGLVGTNRIDGKEVIPFLAQEREAYLEYDLTALVYRLSTPKKPMLGLITSLPLEAGAGAGGMMAAMQGQTQPFIIYEQLRQTHDTQVLGKDFAAIPADVNVLLLAHPGKLTPAQLYAIDQFVLRGGRVLALVDPDSELAAAAGGVPESDLAPLFKSWGVGFDPRQVVVDRDLAQQVQVPDDALNPVVSYPLWLHLGRENFDRNDPLTADLQALNLATTGALMPRSGASTTFTALVTSSDRAMLMSGDDARAKLTPQQILARFKPSGERYIFAARIAGPVKTAFPDGPPAGAARETYLRQSQSDANIIVVADSDFLEDRFWVRVETLLGKRLASSFADNGAFVLNAVENLMGSNDLISLRTRATNERPFTRVRKIQAEAQAKFQSEADLLKQKLSDTQERLKVLQQADDGKDVSQDLGEAQQTEVERFRRELLETRTQLRDVQLKLRQDVDRLGRVLTFVNIALVPLLVAMVAVILALLRRRRRRRALLV